MYEDHERQQAEGTKPDLAKLRIAHKIVATTLARWTRWKKQEIYTPEIYCETEA